jgi:hypothetical protein
MGKPRSREPAEAFSREVGTPSRDENVTNRKPARPVRRSIVDLTEAARRAAEDGVLPVAPAAVRDDTPRRAHAASPPPVRGRASHRARVRPVGDETVAPGESETSRDASATCELEVSDSTADMAVKIAKTYQANTLDDIKAGFNAALDYAAEFAKRGASSEAANHASADGGGDDRRNALAAQYRAEAVELMKVNVATSFDLARQLLVAKTAAEWVELASTHARLQCELMLRQTRALRSFARTVTKSDAG